MPANPDLFSKYKNPAQIKVSTFRKMAHSASNKISSMSKKSVGATLVEQGNNAVAVMAIGSSIAVAASSTAAFAVAMTGPAAGIALGVIGIALVAKSMYSNRETAHAALTPYMFSLIDSTAPTPLPADKPSLEKLGGAALSLITDSQAQVSQGQSKLASAETAFNAWLRSYGEANRWHQRYKVDKQPGNKALVVEHEPARQALVTNAEKSGGAIFEYMRRLVHFGNYIQIFEFFGKVLKGDTASWTESAAFGSYLTTVQTTRQNLEKIVALVDADSAAAEEAAR